MISRIVPISVPNINYDTFYFIQSSIDNKLNLTGRTFKDYLEDLQEFFLSDNVWTHLHFSFMIAGTFETLLDLLAHSSFSISYKRKGDLVIALVSGSLHNWRQLIISFSNSSVNTPSRLIANDLQLYFEKEHNFHNLFNKYRKSKLKDGTFLLEYINNG